jgi:hypothetical protein
MIQYVRGHDVMIGCKDVLMTLHSTCRSLQN